MWARTLLNVCGIGCDIFGLDKNARSMWAFVQFHPNHARISKKQARRIFFFQTFSPSQLQACRRLLLLLLLLICEFRVLSSFDVQCYFLLLWWQWRDVKGFVRSPPPRISFGKGALDVVCRYCPCGDHCPPSPTCIMRLNCQVMWLMWLLEDVQDSLFKSNFEGNSESCSKTTVSV